MNLKSVQKNFSDGILSFLIARFVDCVRHYIYSQAFYQVKVDAMRNEDAGFLLAMANAISGFVAMNPKGIEIAVSNGNASSVLPMTAVARLRNENIN